MHTDGSIFSFNLLLNEPTDFDGGGTFFEATGQTVSADTITRSPCHAESSRQPLPLVRPPRHATPPQVRASRGAAVGHSGQARHSGVAITRGERYLLVGFIACAA